MSYLQCKAKSKRTGERCKARAMRGKQVCYHHGGMSTGRPVTHGRYSRSLQSLAAKNLLETYEYNKTDPDPLNLLSEIALLRTWLQEYQQQYAGQFHPKTLDIIKGFVSDIASVVRHHHAIQYGERVSITVREWESYTTRVLELVREIYGDDDRYARFLTSVERLYSAQSRQSSEGAEQTA